MRGCSSSDANGVLERGFEAISRESWSEAEEVFVDLVDSDDASVEAWLGWAIVQHRMGCRDEAASAVRQALALLAEDELEIQVLGELYSDIALEEDALPFLLRAADMASGDLDEMERIAGLMLSIGYVKWGADMAKRVLRANPDRPNAWLIAGLSSFVDSDWDEAVKGFEECIERDPSNAMAHISLGMVRLEQHRMEEAIEHFDFVLSLPATNEEDKRYACSAMIGRARAFLSMKRQGDAEEAIAEAAAVAHDNAAALFDIGMFYLDDLESAKEALPFLEEAARLDPDDPFKQVTLAHVQLEVDGMSSVGDAFYTVESRSAEMEDGSTRSERPNASIRETVCKEKGAYPDGAWSSTDELYQLRIEIAGIRPPIWRRLLVPTNFTLGQLHNVIQAAFGWEDAHMHEFRIGSMRYTRIEDVGDLWNASMCDEAKAPLDFVVGKCNGSFAYTYDLGDMWIHKVTVEKRVKRVTGQRYPVCLSGRRASPPENIGGVYGYTDLLDAMRQHDEDRIGEYLGWMKGNYDPERFDVEDVNTHLEEVSDTWADC